MKTEKELLKSLEATESLIKNQEYNVISTVHLL